MKTGILVLLVLFFFTTLSQGSKPLAEPIYGGRLRGALSSDILNWDPIYAVDTKTGHLISLVYANLFRYEHKSLALQPELVEQWWVEDHGLTYLFLLRDGVYFTNGEQLTAYDVAYSWERLKDPKLHSPRSWLVEKIADIQVKDPLLLRVRLRQPAPELLYITTMPNLAIVPRQHGDLKTTPLGSGPWVLDQWELDYRLSLKANPDYIGGRPFLNYLDFHILGEIQEQLRFEGGKLDFAAVSPGIYPRWANMYPTQFYWQEKPNTYYVGLNCQMSPFDQVVIRQALNYGTNRRQIIDYVLQTQAREAYGPVPPQIGGTKQANYFFDPERARELLATAAFPLTTMELWVVNDPTLVLICQALKSQWAQLGIEVDLVLSDFAGLQQATTSGKLDSFLLGWSMDYPLMENFLQPTFSKNNWGAGGNRCFFFDQDVQDDLVNGRYQKAEQQIISLAPWVFLWHGVEGTVVQPWVENWQTHPSYYGLDFTQVYIRSEKHANQ